MKRSLKLTLGVPLSVCLVHYGIQNQQKIKQESKKIKTYLWGNGVYQARPDATMNFSNFKPKEIENWKHSGDNIQMRSLAFGGVYNGGIDVKGRLIISKKHFMDSAQPCQQDTQVSEYKIVEDEMMMEQLAFSNGFLWGLSKEGQVYQWKTEKDNYVDTHSGFKVGNRRHLKSLSEYSIRGISAGEDHLLLLTNEGQVLALGDDTYGQCGIGSVTGGLNRQTMAPFIGNRVINPHLISMPQKVTQIQAGTHHSLALLQDGSVYVWGSNSHLQLSHQKEYSKASEPLMAIYQPSALPALLEKDIQVTHMAAGQRFSVFAGIHRPTGQTEVFSCGDNMRGQLGTGYTRHVQDLTLVEDLSHFKVGSGSKRDGEVRITQMQCGTNHCIAKLSVGAVVQWGDNEYGQLGNGKRTYMTSPKIMGVFRKQQVDKVFAGGNHSAATAFDF